MLYQDAPTKVIKQTMLDSIEPAEQAIKEGPKKENEPTTK